LGTGKKGLGTWVPKSEFVGTQFPRVGIEIHIIIAMWGKCAAKLGQRCGKASAQSRRSRSTCRKPGATNLTSAAQNQMIPLTTEARFNHPDNELVTD
jgi:hypothetical protein